MVYSPEEKHRMDLLLAAFENYCTQSEYFDIAYSDKTGFIRLIIEEDSENLFFQINGFDDMLKMFIDDHLLEEE